MFAARSCIASTTLITILPTEAGAVVLWRGLRIEPGVGIVSALVPDINSSRVGDNGWHTVPAVVVRVIKVGGQCAFQLNFKAVRRLSGIVHNIEAGQRSRNDRGLPLQQNGVIAIAAIIATRIGLILYFSWFNRAIATRKLRLIPFTAGTETFGQ